MKISQQTKKQVVRKPAVKKEQKRGIWQTIIKTIVRPPRTRYNTHQLGLTAHSMAGDLYKRRDIEIVHEGKKIEISVFDPPVKKNKLILYLHGNSSSRLESKNLIKYLPKGYSLAGFDFIGCGNNHQADTITLGHNQSKQVQTVANYLRSEHYQVILWGRSMGAVSALKYGKADVIVADSPFRDIRKLFKQMSTHQKGIPDCVVSCFFPCVFWKIKKDVKEHAQYDLGSLNIEKAVSKISPATTVIFLTGNRDTLIDQYNSKKLYSIFQGTNKYLQVVDGNHNDKRPQKTVFKIMQIIEQKSLIHDILQRISPEEEKCKKSEEQEDNTENFNLYRSQKEQIKQSEIQLELKEDRQYDNL